MALTWITPAGDLGILQERITVNIPLEATSSLGNPITYEIISGRLPQGLLLQGNTIKGTPAEVTKYTETRFVVREAMEQMLGVAIEHLNWQLTEVTFQNG